MPKEKEEQKEQEDLSKELEAVKIDDNNNDDDYFEKVLEMELPYPTDDDAGTDTSDKKVADSSEEKPKAEEESVDSLKAKIAELEKEAKGRLTDTVKSRQEKAAMKAELSELKGAVQSLLDKRDNALKEELAEEDKPIDLSRRDINFDEDDKAFVDLSDVDKKIQAETKSTREELEALKAERLAEKTKQEFQNNVNTIISESPDAFQPAWNDLQSTYKDLNEAVINLQDRLGIMDDDGTISQDQAIDLLQGTDELKEFTEKHPGIDPIKIARAFNSKVDFRNSLRDIATAKSYGKKAENEIEDVIKKAQNKPGSLLGSGNQAGSNVSLIDRIAQLDTSKIFDFSDAEVAKIEAMLEQEELKGE